MKNLKTFTLIALFMLFSATSCTIEDLFGDPENPEIETPEEDPEEDPEDPEEDPEVEPEDDDPTTFAGDGTEDSPYLINSVAKLWLLSDRVNAGETFTGIYFRVTKDLDLEGNEDNQWTPIGSYGNSIAFKGIFDGDDHLISGIYINTPDDYIGLFSYTYNAEIKNLGVNGTITGGNYVGGVVGHNFSSTVNNCYNTGNVSASKNYVGGVVGLNNYDSTVSNCYNTGNMSGISDVGGVVGLNYSYSIVSDCYNTGDMSGINSVGGVAGVNTSSSTVSNCYNTGGVSASGKYIGGVIGYNNNNSTVSNCYNTRDVSGSSYVGGVVGWSSSSTVTNCYNTGDVSGSSYTGGVVGRNSSSFVSNCYSLEDTVVSGSGGENGTVKTQSEMKASEMVTLLNADQETVAWEYDSKTINSGYPILEWQE